MNNILFCLTTQKQKNNNNNKVNIYMQTLNYLRAEELEIINKFF